MSQRTPYLVDRLKEAGQDFEFYPTTREIINAMIADIRSVTARRKSQQSRWEDGFSFGSFLDIGAGNGKVLDAIRDSDLGLSAFYAIEKSPILIQQLDPKIFIVGTDFWHQTLLNKRVGITFTNPPYSEFRQWTAKVLRESVSSLVYLVIPERWQNDPEIAGILKKRSAQTKVVGRFDFMDSEDRTARAYVELVRVELALNEDESFKRFFEDEFPDVAENFAKVNAKSGDEEKAHASPKAEQLVVGADYPEAMVSLYNEELLRLRETYAQMGKLDPNLLKELGVDLAKVIGSLKHKIDGLRTYYWTTLFKHLKAVSDRLTNKRRDLLLNTLNKQTDVDFTVENISAVIIWLLKNANAHLDGQLVETYDLMIDKANVKLYKSNQKPFVQDRWRYNAKESTNTHFYLEYRIVLHQVGGLDTQFSWSHHLKDSGAEFFQDLLTVARNLGFACDTQDSRLNWDGRRTWRAGQSQVFYYQDTDNQSQILFEVKAFKNGNMHARLSPKLALALNVEYGRLRGWIATGQEAAEELRDPKAAAVFNSHFALSMGQPFLALK